MGNMKVVRNDWVKRDMVEEGVLRSGLHTGYMKQVVMML